MPGSLLSNVRAPLNLQANDANEITSMSDGLNGRVIVLEDLQIQIISWCISTPHAISYTTLILLFASHDTPLTHRCRYYYPIPDGTRVPHWAYLDVMVCFVSARSLC
jgi:hypothetical protein